MGFTNVVLLEAVSAAAGERVALQRIRHWHRKITFPARREFLHPNVSSIILWPARFMLLGIAAVSRGAAWQSSVRGATGVVQLCGFSNSIIGRADGG